ncbi:hypothetical protein SARI_03837 [Salmonella enterica subsp. arizonae serovar 62:z4,z23:-]|uniref:Uncharacterized protein n=1 Tax=Salmonella arizonae (strain ATCC BAA-731 / CDC346-86 / RSK2980) TaxID=41514 RepID=A9MJX1_SALAR|nr:hypothetical protein SARI_03837 [Salmonella enterica subsp. arizonae serovar 62:z4,z23:-]
MIILLHAQDIHQKRELFAKKFDVHYLMYFF